MNHLKFVDGSTDTIEGWGAPYGGPFNGRDLDGEYFSQKTNFCEDWFTERPVLYNHGLDDETKTAVVGRVKAWERRDKGMWVRAQLDQQSEYFEAIKQLVDSEKLFYSSGAMAHLVEKTKSGEITRWPWVEQSLTPTPANLLATVDAPTVTKHFKAAGLDLDALNAKLETVADIPAPVSADDGTAKSATAPAIKSVEGSYEDLIDDLTRLLNPATPFGDGCYTSILATFPTSVIAQRYDYGSDDVEDTFWQVEYTIGDDGDPVLGKATPVEQTYVPAKSYTTESPITLDAQLLSRHAGAFSERTKDLGERRIAAGRPLSISNRASVVTAIDRLDGAKAALQSTVDASDQLQTAQARAEALRQPDSLQRRLAALDLLIETAPA